MAASRLLNTQWTLDWERCKGVARGKKPYATLWILSSRELWNSNRQMKLVAFVREACDRYYQSCTLDKIAVSTANPMRWSEAKQDNSKRIRSHASHGAYFDKKTAKMMEMEAIRCNAHIEWIGRQQCNAALKMAIKRLFGTMWPCGTIVKSAFSWHSVFIS